MAWAYSPGWLKALAVAGAFAMAMLAMLATPQLRPMTKPLINALGLAPIEENIDLRTQLTNAQDKINQLMAEKQALINNYTKLKINYDELHKNYTTVVNRYIELLRLYEEANKNAQVALKALEEMKTRLAQWANYTSTMYHSTAKLIAFKENGTAKVEIPVKLDPWSLRYLRLNATWETRPIEKPGIPGLFTYGNPQIGIRVFVISIVIFDGEKAIAWRTIFTCYGNYLADTSTRVYDFMSNTNQPLTLWFYTNVTKDKIVLTGYPTINTERYYVRGYQMGPRGPCRMDPIELKPNHTYVMALEVAMAPSKSGIAYYGYSIYWMIVTNMTTYINP